MAIVNVTPDSFSDGGQRFDAAQAVDDGLRFVSEGADIIDVGGESTRPGSEAVPEREELHRVLPVVERLAGAGVTVSVDTRRAVVARACLDAGARIVNDVSALRDDPELLPLVVERGAAVVLMHRRGQSENKYEGPAYADVVAQVRQFLLERAATCEAAGVVRQNIVLDPGIGFGKTPAENLALIAAGGKTGAGLYPILIGTSRKGFIGRLTDVKEPRMRDPASIWLAVEATRRGAAIVRVHDVAGTRQALAISAMMR
ncbi:dihydropteroate synthase [Enhydrobacter aerosaccus]|uniref:dihydropteroate synthase n=1 Tax=Enhydrobacter aerosaccus TaxID=225324 RepID=A0A1T4K6A4_9HYPH|nr:dihydropteroate synthase [Enhydrobacter aerosaccus]SJZ37825.1 dihydropteroate synthase [Enhydrobacter aerosaccus]